MLVQRARRFLIATGLLLGCGGEGVPVRFASIEMTLGAGEAGTPNRFGDIAGIAADAEGRIYVADGQVSEVRVFAPDGAFLYKFGGEGKDGGKLFGPCCLAFDPAGRLWVRDAGNVRYSVFAPTAQRADYLYSVPMAHQDVLFSSPLTFDPAGNVIDIARVDTAGVVGNARFTLDSTGVARDTLVLMPVPPDSLEVTTVETPEGPAVIHTPFRVRDLIAYGPRGDFARATSSRYVVKRYDVNGNLKQTLTLDDVIGPPLNNEERHRAAAMINEEAKLVGRPGTDLAAKLPFRKQPIAALYFDQDGRLWVERSMRLHEHTRADVWDANGTRSYIAEWNNEVQLQNGYIRGEVAFGIQPGPEERGGPRLIKLVWKK